MCIHIFSFVLCFFITRCTYIYIYICLLFDSNYPTSPSDGSLLYESVARSIARSLGRSVDRPVGRSFGCSIVRSLGRPVARSPAPFVLW